MQESDFTTFLSTEGEKLSGALIFWVKTVCG